MTLPSGSLISSVEYRRLDVALNESFAISGGAAKSAELLLLRIRDNQGNMGVGEAAPFPAYDGVHRDDVLQSVLSSDLSFLNGECFGDDESGDLESFHQRLSGAVTVGPLIAAMEMAWLDLQCQQLQMPLYRYFGGRAQDLETGITIVVGNRSHAVESSKNFIAQGFQNLKVKLSGDLELDLDRLLKIREIGPDCRLLLDANGAFDLEGAIELIAGLKSQGIVVDYLEQPLPKGFDNQMVELSSRSPIPILADESCTSHDSVVSALEEFGFAGVNLKIQKSGIFEAIRMHLAAKERGALLMIGGMVESPLSMTCSAHLAKALGGFDWVDLDTPLFMPEHPFFGGIKFDRGVVLLGDEAGLGITIQDEYPGFIDSDWIKVWQGDNG